MLRGLQPPIKVAKPVPVANAGRPRLDRFPGFRKRRFIVASRGEEPDPAVGGIAGEGVRRRDMGEHLQRLLPLLAGGEQFAGDQPGFAILRSEEHTSELQSIMRISYAVFCLKKKK